MDLERPAYTEIVIAGAALRTFACVPQAATVTDTGCAARWTKANSETRAPRGHILSDAAKSLDACARCPIGALHADKPFVDRSEFFAAAICPRCGVGTTRMIHNRICVGCYNREREVLIGLNRRGNAPSAPPLVQVRLNLHVNGRLIRESRTVITPHVAEVRVGPKRKGASKCDTKRVERGGMREAMLQVLRTRKGGLTFAPARRPLSMQLVLPLGYPPASIQLPAVA